MIKTMLKSRLSRFVRETDGNMSLEAVIFLPLVLAIIAATFSFHDAFRYKSLNTKAAFTISDALSRETDPIDDAYLDGMLEVLEFLTRSEGPYSLRVTLVRYDGETDTYEAAWSQVRGSFNAMSTADSEAIRAQLPQLLHNERVIVVETKTEYDTPFPIPGVSTEDMFYNLAFTRPRFAPQLVWQETDTGGA